MPYGPQLIGSFTRPNPNWRWIRGTDYADSYAEDVVSIGVFAPGRPNCHGLLRLTCTGPTVTVQVANSIGAGAIPDQPRIAVYVDNVYSQNILPLNINTCEYYTITIPAGSHTVEFAAGQESKPAAVVLGSWVCAVYGTDVVVLPKPAVTRMAIIYSDSIADGQPSIPGKTDWVSIFRALYAASTGGRTACESWGFRGLFDDDVTVLANKLLAISNGATIVDVIPVIGTNDYGLEKQNAAAFTTQYTAFLTAIRTAFGVRLRKGHCVTPFTRATESANGLGSTLADYRAGIVTAVGAANDAHVISGTAMGLVLPTDYDDGIIHPNDLGHAKIAPAIHTAVIA